jgi:hypothetical protein
LLPHKLVRMVDMAALTDDTSKRIQQDKKLGVGFDQNAAAEEEEPVLHLKSFCSMCGPGGVLVGGTIGKVFGEWANSEEVHYPGTSTYGEPYSATGGSVGGSGEDAPSSTHSGEGRGAQVQQGRRRRQNRHLKYDIVHVPDVAAANCLFINGTIVRRCSHEFPSSEPYFQAHFGRNALSWTAGGFRTVSAVTNIPVGGASAAGNQAVVVATHLSPVSACVLPPHLERQQITVAAGELAKVDGALSCCSLLF